MIHWQRSPQTTQGYAPVLFIASGGFFVSAILDRTTFYPFLEPFAVTELSQYPPGAQAVDQNLARSVEGLRNTVETGFDRIDRRMDSMVTKDAHIADISRLDQRVDHTNEKVDQGFLDIKRDMAEGFAAIAGRDADRDRAAEKRDEERDKKFARRMTWTLAVVGLAWTVAQFFITPLLQK